MEKFSDEYISARVEEIKEELQEYVEMIENKIKTEMHWSDEVYKTFRKEINSVNWGQLDENDKPNYPSFDEFVKGKVFDWIKKNGGTITEKYADSDHYIFKLPNSSEKLEISDYSYNHKNAIYYPDALRPAFNYPIQKVEKWLIEHHYSIIEERIKKEVKRQSDHYIMPLKLEIAELTTDYGIDPDEFYDIFKKYSK